MELFVVSALTQAMVWVRVGVLVCAEVQKSRASIKHSLGETATEDHHRMPIGQRTDENFLWSHLAV